MAAPGWPYRQTGDRHGEANALNNLGVALREVRRYEEAITACEEAAAVSARPRISTMSGSLSVTSKLPRTHS